RQVEDRVEQHRRVAGREHEAVAVRPDRIARVEAQEALPEAVRHRRHAHRRARVARLGFLDRVDAEGPDRGDAELVEIVWIALAHGEPSRPVLQGSQPADAREARAGDDELGSEPDAAESACPGQPGQTMTSQNGYDHGEIIVRAPRPLLTRTPSAITHGVRAVAIPDSRPALPVTTSPARDGSPRAAPGGPGRRTGRCARWSRRAAAARRPRRRRARSDPAAGTRW